MVRKLEAGFSLIELLVVIAIIGILATVGVPTYSRMVAKAKKSEAASSLGGLYTAEAAFFAEYNMYGNRIARTGFQLDGGPRNYTVGFPMTAGVCATATAGIAPDITDPNGVQLNSIYAAYYATVVANDDFVLYRTSATPATAASNCVSATMPATGQTFTATATGPITRGDLPTSALALQDQWTITDGRVLANINDGIH